MSSDDSDLYLLGAIIQCEADGEPYEGKPAVGSVVSANRVRKLLFPEYRILCDLSGATVFPVASGRYATRLGAWSQ